MAQVRAATVLTRKVQEAPRPAPLQMWEARAKSAAFEAQKADWRLERKVAGIDVACVEMHPAQQDATSVPAATAPPTSSEANSIVSGGGEDVGGGGSSPSSSPKEGEECLGAGAASNQGCCELPEVEVAPSALGGPGVRSHPNHCRWASALGL